MIIPGNIKDKFEFTLEHWLICGCVVFIIVLATLGAVYVWYRRRHRLQEDGSETQSENPTIATAVEGDQLHEYSLTDPPDLSYRLGTMPNAPPDILDGAIGPVYPVPIENGYSLQNLTNQRKADIPPPLYDSEENDDLQLDNDPPPYTP